MSVVRISNGFWFRPLAIFVALLIATSPAGATSYQYEDNGWLKKRTLPNSTYTDYLYEENGALRSLVNKTSGNTTLSSFGTFVYDGVFNLKNVTSSVPAQTSYQGTQTWVYDTKDRMTSEAGTRLSGYTHSFGYDSAGNPTTFKGATRTFNDDNQRTATGYAYDGNGNPTTYNSTTLTFDVENRMTALGSHAYGYRSDGLRAWKQASSASAKTYFLYDGSDPIVEMDSSGNMTAINDHAPDGLVGRKVGSTWTYYVFDQQGNVAERLAANESVNSHSVYDAYGVETATGSPSDPFGYNGQWGYYQDRETGYYLCQNRYYDPNNGRWFTRDPIGYGGGINLYGYCASGPIGATDPSGLAVQGAAVLWPIIETVGDIVGLGMDIADFANKPGLDTGGFLLWSLAGLTFPGIPGSWPRRLFGAANDFGRKAEDTCKALNKIEPSAEVKEATELLSGQGIYVGTHKPSKKPYVGKTIDGFTRTHKNHLDTTQPRDFIPIQGDAQDLANAEQTGIDSLGGILSGLLGNKRNAVGPKKRGGNSNGRP